MSTQPERTVWLSSPLHPQCCRAYWHVEAGSSCQLNSQDVDELSGTLRHGRRGQQLLATCPAACSPFYHQHQHVAPMVKTQTEWPCLKLPWEGNSLLNLLTETVTAMTVTKGTHLLGTPMLGLSTDASDLQKSTMRKMLSLWLHA